MRDKVGRPDQTSVEAGGHFHRGPKCGRRDLQERAREASGRRRQRRRRWWRSGRSLRPHSYPRLPSPPISHSSLGNSNFLAVLDQALWLALASSATATSAAALAPPWPPANPSIKTAPRPAEKKPWQLAFVDSLPLSRGLFAVTCLSERCRRHTNFTGQRPCRQLQLGGLAGRGRQASPSSPSSFARRFMSLRSSGRGGRGPAQACIGGDVTR